jgi:glycosyltransferase involved in cell wall biosynthesis
VLIIGYVWPEPRSSAAGSRMLQLIQWFVQQSWEVTFGSAALLSDQRADLTALGVEEKMLALNCASVDEYVAALKPDLVVFDRFFTEEQFGWRVAQAWPAAVRVLDTEDLHCLRSVREQLLKNTQKQQASQTQKYSLDIMQVDESVMIDELLTADIAQREIAAIYRCDLSLIISTAEMQLLTRHFSVPENLLLYCPFLAVQQLTDTPDFAERQHFVTIGNFRHAPNWDAVLCLKHVLWPLIRAQLPHAQLHIYGAYLPPKASALHQPAAGFYVDGWTPDAVATVSRARVCLAPLRFGAGLKGKLWEAMECGTPSVTTRIGAEAMHGDLPWGGAIADSDQAFATAAITLHEAQAHWQAAAAQSSQLLHDLFSPADTLTHLRNRLDELFENLLQHRRRNFTGSMLHHHLHKSTQYMSQWIEVKTRLQHLTAANDRPIS